MHADLIGSTIGQYRIVERIGAGGMGVVYKAYQESLARHVAIKMLLFADARETSFLARFRREARAVAQLDHVNILPVYDFGEHDSLPFIVMPLLTSGTLDGRIGPLMPLPEVLDICSQLAAALDYAHSEGIVHRDVKPSNVLIGRDGRLLLADFGLAKIAGETSSLSSAGPFGTPAYMSPEQCLGHEVGPQSDQYALAAMAFELLTGRRPFQGSGPIDIVWKQINGPVPSASAVNPLVLTPVDNVIQRGMAKRPEDRFASCRDLVTALVRAAEGAEDDGAAPLRATQAAQRDEPRDRGAPASAAEAAPVARSSATLSWPPPAPAPAEPARSPSPKPRRQWDRIRTRVAARWYVPVLVLALVLGAALKAQSLQSESPPPPMTGVFNFAIADFGQIGDDGEVVAWGQGKNEGDRLFERVRAQLASMPSLTGMVEVRRQDVGLVRGKTPAERGHAAAQLAQKLGAHMVLYGNLERKGNEQWFEPEFFITGLSEAEELVGSGRLGTPIITEGSVDDIAGRLERSEALRARSEALTLFAIGLTYLAVDRPASAVDFFEQANAVQGWRDNEGKEVLYLFMGTAYRLRGAGGDTERAITAFSQAARLNPDYARAYVALGTVYLEEFDRTGQADFRNLDQAVVEYERAAGAKDQPESPLLDAKLHISLGNAYVVKAQAGDRDAFLHARDEFERIVRAYESGNAALQRAAAHAYLGLGIVAERGDHDCARAATFYRSAAEVATALRNREVKQLAEAQLAACGGVSAPLIS